MFKDELRVKNGRKHTNHFFGSVSEYVKLVSELSGLACHRLKLLRLMHKKMTTLSKTYKQRHSKTWLIQ